LLKTQISTGFTASKSPGGCYCKNSHLREFTATCSCQNKPKSRAEQHSIEMNCHLPNTHIYYKGINAEVRQVK